VNRQSDLGYVTRVSLDGDTVTKTRIVEGHHATVQHDDGSYAFLNHDFRDVPAGPVTATILTDNLMEVAEGATDGDEPRQVFSFYEDYYDSDPETFPYPCWHTTTLEALHGHPALFEWTHSNSLMYSADEAAYLVHARLVDTLVKIDRDSGEMLWQLSGPNSDFTAPDGSELWTGVGDSALFSHGHMTQWWDGGFTMFDNGDHHSEVVSSFVEVAYDEATMTAEVVFRYTEPTDGWVPALGDVKKLADGNYLVAWTTLGVVSQVSPEGEEIWRAELALGNAVTRLAYVESLYELLP